MNHKSYITANATELRRRAEQRVRERSAVADVTRSAADTQRLLHELQVHQMELEMQNEELVRAREVSEAALEKYSDLYDFAPVAYVTLDSAGTILEANFAMSSLVGIERSRLVGQSFRHLVVAADRPAFTALLQKAAASQDRTFCEAALVKDDSSAVAVRIEAVRAASGEEVRVAVLDVTERRRAEADRLVLSKLESTGILAGGIAHDFNNLLAVILLDLEQAQLLAPGSEEFTRLFEETKNTVMMARGLTQQLITFAHGGAPMLKPAYLTDIITASVRPAVSGSRVRCDLALADGLWSVEVDEGQIGQVVRNLVLNARESMPDGGVVSVRAENMIVEHAGDHGLPLGEYVRVSVIDHGGGIAPSVQAKIFDPYFSTKQRGTAKGMGLGLAICHAVIQKHGGAIEVESELGVGTTFHLYLPASHRRPEKAAAVPSAPQSRCGTILVMDDEEPLRRALGGALRLLGHEVDLVANGEQAIEAYRRAHRDGKSFDLVLLDLTVRDGMGGRETLEELRRMDPAVKAIVMTGYANEAAVSDPGPHGFMGALVKPFDGVKLAELISRLLEERPGEIDQLSVRSNQ